MPKLLQVVSGKPPAMLYNKAIESGSNFDHSNYNYGIINFLHNTKLIKLTPGHILISKP